MIQARINKIIDHSVVDGPGNRTAIFFQGCNLNCHYCHNPETINQCLNCGLCVATCPVKALSIHDGRVCYDPAKCIQCDTCLKTCPHDSSPKTVMMSVAAVVARIKNNLPFIRGITLSGGECTLNPDFIKELFKQTRLLGLTNLLDSNGTYDFAGDPTLLNDCDGVMLDIKAFGPEDHLRITDHSNQQILANARYLAECGKLTEIRTVIIPKALDNEYTVQAITAMLKPYLELNHTDYKLIRYRPFGVRKRYCTFEQPDDALMNKLAALARANGFCDIIII